MSFPNEKMEHDHRAERVSRRFYAPFSTVGRVLGSAKWKVFIKYISDIKRSRSHIALVACSPEFLFWLLVLALSGSLSGHLKSSTLDWLPECNENEISKKSPRKKRKEGKKELLERDENMLWTFTPPYHIHFSSHTEREERGEFSAFLPYSPRPLPPLLLYFEKKSKIVTWVKKGISGILPRK